jgi:hypothetical protein
MNDLIWVGNTLLPRWFVFVVPIVVVSLVAVIVILIRRWS